MATKESILTAALDLASEKGLGNVSLSQIAKKAGIQKASGVPNKTKVASVTKAQVEEIAKTKMPDLNAASLEAAASMIAGTARSMGITVTD